jgi:SAM-dependent methyltransferase
MDLQAFRLLLTHSGQQALQAAVSLAPRESDYLRCLTGLRRQYPKELAEAALETAILRQEAAVKFTAAAQMYFTRQALEQASGQEVSRYRSRRFADCERLLDLGCSVGGDTLALAELAPTTGIDLDPLRLNMAAANLAGANLKVLNTAHETMFIQADLRDPLPLRAAGQTGAFFDPARRTAERRVFSVQRYLPPLDTIRNWLPQIPALGVKLSPGVDLAELESYGGEVEFISLRGELKEAVLWLGPLKTARRRATVLPGAVSSPRAVSSPQPATMAGEPDLLSADSVSVKLSEPQAYLYEPDPSVLRAGLVRMLGVQLKATQLDPDIAYLTGDLLLDTPFAKAYQVEEWLPFNLKRLRSLLRVRGVERAVVKKRGSPIQPEALIRDLRLQPPGEGGGLERIIFLTHLRGEPIVVICLPRTVENVR